VSNDVMKTVSVREFVPLNLDLAILHHATGAASLLNRLGQLLLFRQTDADKTLYHPRDQW